MPLTNSAPALTRVDGTPLRVLVVDDEVNIAELIGMAVRYEGWEPVLACDWEAASVEATAENAAVNGVPGIAVARTDLRREEGPWAPVVVANLVRPLLLEVAGIMTRAPETLIVSGLLREEGDEVATAFGRHGLRETARRTAGEWCALRLDR